MDTILCKKCETGNPGYLRYCSNCNADLFDETNVDTEPPPAVDEAKLRRNGKIAVVVSVFTTALKIWMLYGLESEAHLGFPQFRDLLAIGIPPVGAAIVSARSKRWYWILIIDSAAMIAVMLFILFVFIAARSRR